MNLPEVYIREYRTMPEIPRMEVSIGSGNSNHLQVECFLDIGMYLLVNYCTKVIRRCFLVYCLF